MRFKIPNSSLAPVSWFLFDLIQTIIRDHLRRRVLIRFPSEIQAPHRHQSSESDAFLISLSAMPWKKNASKHQSWVRPTPVVENNAEVTFSRPRSQFWSSGRVSNEKFLGILVEYLLSSFCKDRFPTLIFLVALCILTNARQVGPVAYFMTALW